ncbi:hypothetical protein CVD19_12310 [Bacillus sp. T33-2]|nr:hypothetical protein CVD19_12310 [Bacillus sp. T33-2]
MCAQQQLKRAVGNAMKIWVISKGGIFDPQSSIKQMTWHTPSRIHPDTANRLISCQNPVKIDMAVVVY